VQNTRRGADSAEVKDVDEALRVVADAAGDDVSAQDVQETLHLRSEGEDTRDHPMELAGQDERRAGVLTDGKM